MMKNKRNRMKKKKNKSKTTSTPTPTINTSVPMPLLDNNLIFSHILPKLPVRCLLRFSCVSKLWYKTIIHDPEFRASHLTHAKSNPSLGAMLCQETFFCFLELIERGGHMLPNNIAYLGLDAGSSHSVGTGNGLTCNILPTAIQICNPSTRELLNIRVLEPTTQMERNASLRNAFGFDPLKNEYKVIHIWTDCDEYYDCRVYTLGTNTWRNVTTTCDYQPYCYPCDFTPICISETLFWTTNKMRSILSFDLHREKFHLIAGPEVPVGSIIHTLFELEGRLCSVYRYDDDSTGVIQLTLFTCTGAGGADVRWIMRPTNIHPPLKPEIEQIQLVEFAKDIYLHWVTMDGRFFLWDVSRNMKRTFHDKVVLDLIEGQWIFLVNHVENLLSLKTFVPPSGGKVDVKYFSSRDAKHESPGGEMKKRKRGSRSLFDYSDGYPTTPYWLSVII